MIPHQPELTYQQRAELSAPTLIAFVETCADWKLEKTEELSVAGYPNPNQYIDWCLAAIDDAPVVLDEWRLLRIGAIVGVEKAMKKLLPRADDRIHWLRAPSRGAICRGQAPFDILSDPEDVHVIEFRNAIEEWISSIFLGPSPVIRTGTVRPKAQHSAVDALLKSLGL